MISCSPVGRYHGVRGTCCLNLQYRNTLLFIPLPWRWTQQIPPILWMPLSWLYTVTLHKTVILILTAVRTWNLSIFVLFLRLFGYMKEGSHLLPLHIEPGPPATVGAVSGFNAFCIIRRPRNSKSFSNCNNVKKRHTCIKNTHKYKCTCVCTRTCVSLSTWDSTPLRPHNV